MNNRWPVPHSTAFSHCCRFLVFICLYLFYCREGNIYLLLLLLLFFREKRSEMIVIINPSSIAWGSVIRNPSFVVQSINVQSFFKVGCSMFGLSNFSRWLPSNPILTALSWQSCPGSLVLAVLPWQSCPCSLILSVLFCLSHSGCPILAVLF